MHTENRTLDLPHLKRIPCSTQWVHVLHPPHTHGQLACVIYTWPGSNWRPSACEADVIATRPQVLLYMLGRLSGRTRAKRTPVCPGNMWMSWAEGTSVNRCQGHKCTHAVLPPGSWHTQGQKHILTVGLCSLMAQSFLVPHIGCMSCIPHTHTRAARLHDLHLARIELATFSV